MANPGPRWDPGPLWPMYVAAHTNETAGLTDRAEEWFLAALEVEPHAPGLKQDLARMYLSEDRHADALPLLEEAVAVRGDDAEWWVLLGYAREGTGDDDGARVAYEQALAMNPEVPGAREQLDGLDDG
jgi:predicted Zn-dependent protease